jgi:formylglycine-generating enzyme required for sulfatase activity
MKITLPARFNDQVIVQRKPKLFFFLLASILFGTTLPGLAVSNEFFRIVANSEHEISMLSSSGMLSWNDASTSNFALIQRNIDDAPEKDKWQEYTLIQATGTAMSVKVFEKKPPPGMVFIPAGSFMMGNATNVFPANEGDNDERPQHMVYVDAFYLEQTEVSLLRWYTLLNYLYNSENEYSFTNDGYGKAFPHPVFSVNWYDAVKWCNARSEKEGLVPVYYSDSNFTSVYRYGEIEPFANWSANGYRLPTEAEWERAARGGTKDHRFPWSDTNTIRQTRANYEALTNTFAYDVNPTGGFHPTYVIGNVPYTSPVGSFAPNDYGLYDMSGNLFEWCWDWYDSSYYTGSPQNNPKGPTGPLTQRVTRGGSWFYYANNSRVSARAGVIPTGASYVQGFRCARNL